MKKKIAKLALGILNVIYAIIKINKIQNKIVLISRQYDNITLDFKLIEQEIKKQDKNIKVIILTKRLKKGIKEKILYIFHMFVQMYHIATSSVVILDSYCIVVSVLKHKKQTKIIQIWHALAAIKKFGYQTIGKQSGTSKLMAEVMHMHKNYDYVLCPSDITKKYFMEAFNVPENKIKKLGLPRIDYILKKDIKKVEEIYSKYPQLKTDKKPIVIYVPTFRKGKKVKYNHIMEKIDPKKYHLIVKLHPLDRKHYENKKDNNIIIDESFSSYDWLKVANKVITDYSSLSVEAGLLNIPTYFYVYDLQEYIKDPGLNFDFNKERIGKYATSNIHTLIRMLDKPYDYNILKDFQEKYISVPKQNCTESLVKFIMELKNKK